MLQRLQAGQLSSVQVSSSRDDYEPEAHPGQSVRAPLRVVWLRLQV
jgi:hypothetical protein